MEGSTYRTLEANAIQATAIIGSRERTFQGQRRDRDTTGISEFFEKIWKGVALHIDMAIIV
jgi:hypothetical protein